MNPIIDNILNSLTPDQAVKMAHRYGADFTIAEANIILPYLKEHRSELKVENKSRLLNGIKPRISPATYSKIEKLVRRII